MYLKDKPCLSLAPQSQVWVGVSGLAALPRCFQSSHPLPFAEPCAILRFVLINDTILLLSLFLSTGFMLGSFLQ